MKTTRLNVTLRNFLIDDRIAEVTGFTSFDSYRDRYGDEVLVFVHDGVLTPEGYEHARTQISNVLGHTGFDFLMETIDDGDDGDGEIKE